MQGYLCVHREYLINKLPDIVLSAGLLGVRMLGALGVVDIGVM